HAHNGAVERAHVLLMPARVGVLALPEVIEHVLRGSEGERRRHPGNSEQSIGPSKRTNRAAAAGHVHVEVVEGLGVRCRRPVALERAGSRGCRASSRRFWGPPHTSHQKRGGRPFCATIASYRCLNGRTWGLASSECIRVIPAATCA